MMASSYSVPTSPVMARSTSHKSQPVTPQRLPHSRAHRYSASQSLYRSPVTPASPYTPLSLRSFASSGSGGSSTLTTPDQIALGVKHLSFSPDTSRAAAGKDQSLADIADNWRSRASENGIKVSSVNDDAHFGDDEASERTLSDTANDSGFLSTEEALLAPALLTNRRKEAALGNRPRAQSHVPPPTTRPFASPTVPRNINTQNLPPTSPLVTRRLNQSQNLISTPPPNKALARQLKLKGSFTDPAHTRRREAFGTLRVPSRQNMNHSLNLGYGRDTSLELFDIDENDFEYDHEYDRSRDEDDGSFFGLDLRVTNANATANNSINNDNNAYGYPTYDSPLLHHQPQYFTSQTQSHRTAAPFSDPFQAHSLSSIAESIEHHFHAHQQAFGVNPGYAVHGDPGYDAQVDIEYIAHTQSQALRIPQQYQQVLGAPPGLGPARRNGGINGNNPAWVPVPAPARAQPETRNIGDNGLNPLGGGHKTPPGGQERSGSAGLLQGCSVCLAPHPRTLAVLDPCGHPLCSGCLTSALNIVGEKDMECAVCRGKVADFRLIGGEDARLAIGGKGTIAARGGRWESQGSFMDPLFSSPGSASSKGREVDLSGLESAFEFGLGLEGIRASTPRLRDEDANGGRGAAAQDAAAKVADNDSDELKEKRARERGRGRGKMEENVVLRIDNVPWDITPPQIKRWLQQPVERVHVLLDPKGKTMSHAYVEVGDVAVAGRVLRGEGGGLDTAKVGRSLVKKERGSVLGKGRRARGVTITRCGQEELMADLFPNWRGTFDGSRPSLAGLDSERVIGALEGGLVGEGEVAGLLHLIREPDSHFLKVPSLPFHSLISILSKFPADVDSRVFWSADVRDMLYDVTYAAVQVLLSRIDRDKQASPSVAENNEYTMDLVSELVKTAMDCHAFTTQQIHKFKELLESCSVPLPNSENTASRSGSSTHSPMSEPKTPENRDLYGRVSDISSATIEGEAPNLNSNPGEALADIAREFGVEAQLVQALAQRLVGLC